MDADLVSELLSDTREIVEMLFEQPLEASQLLAHEVREYRDYLRTKVHPAADLELGILLADRNLELLQFAATTSADAQHLAQIAARYFVLSVDGDDDLASPFGFDDDIEVFNAIAVRLGQHALCVEP